MASSQPLSYNLPRAPCAVCGAEGLPCARCRLDYYCGKAHQKEHWERHKAGCGVLEVRRDVVLGRHVVAVKDVPRGTLLLKETPAVVAFTTQTSDIEVWCVGCTRILGPLGLRWQGCAVCGWPVCGPLCSAADMHRAECAQFKRAGFKLDPDALGAKNRLVAIQRWGALSALRTHLASKQTPRILELQSAIPSSREVEEYDARIPMLQTQWARKVVADISERGAVRWLVNVAGLKWLSEEELDRASGVFETNSMFSKTQETQSCELFLGLSLLQHDCGPSAFGMSAEGVGHLVVAARDLRAGDAVSIAYTDCEARLATWVRRANLCKWGFVCRCARCLDPTEDGLYKGSICCPPCSAKGQRSLMVSREEWSGTWRCEQCAHSMDAAAYAFGSDTETGTLGTRIEKLDAFIERSLWPRGRLHATHQRILEAKQRICELLQSNADRTVAELTRHGALLRELLAAFDATNPGQLSAIRHGFLSRLFDVDSRLAYAAIERVHRKAGPQLRRTLKPLVKNMDGVLEEMRPYLQMDPKWKKDHKWLQDLLNGIKTFC